MKIRTAIDDDVFQAIEDAVDRGTEQFVDILVDEMRSSGVPESVIKDASTLHAYAEPDVSKYRSHKTGWYGKMRVDMELTFEDASRESFSGGPLRNIVALFDQGYGPLRYNKMPAGEWHGTRIVAPKSRSGMRFMQSAMRRARREIDGLSKVKLEEF